MLRFASTASSCSFPTGSKIPLRQHLARTQASRAVEADPAELANVRSIAPDVPILVPGVGAQGGDTAAVVENGKRADGRGLIVSSSRAVLYASRGADFADAARAEAERTSAALFLA